MAKRIGPRMMAVLDVVGENPGCTKIVPARAVAPHGTGLKFGYNTVNRCIAAGLIEAKPTGRGYRLTLTWSGSEVIARRYE